jgi:O-antigen/teichoic acid export membrane protein
MIEVGRTSFINVVGNGTRIIISFLTTIMVSRWLGAADFGDASLLVSSFAFLYYFFTCGFDHSLTFFVSRFLADGQVKMARKALRVAVVSSITVGVLCSMVIVTVLPTILRWSDKSHLLWPSLIFLFQMPIGALANVMAGDLRGQKRFFPVIFKDQILVPVVTLVGAVAWTRIYAYGVPGYGFAQLAGYLAGLLFMLITIWRHQPREEIWVPPENEDPTTTPLPTNPSAWAMIRFSLPVGLGNTLEPLVSHASIMVGSLFLTPTDIGRFSVSLRVAIFAQFFLQSISPVFSPFFSELFKRRQHDELKSLHHNVHFWCAKWSLYFGFCVLIAGDYLLLPFGTQYEGSEGVLLLLTLGCLIEGALGNTRQSLLMAGHNFMNLINFGLAVVLNVVLPLVMLPHFGVWGLAAAYSLTFLLLNVGRCFQFWWITRIWPLSKPQALNLAGFLGFMMVIHWALWQLQLAHTLRAVVVGVILVTTFILLFWKDRDLIRMTLRRFST